jgi:D-tyrosyl-tRNA(Tyr) deacylase
MKAVVQRSKESSVTVDGKVIGKIDKGLVVLLGVRDDDTLTDLDYIVKKVVNLRIFDDENGVMNKSILDVGGDILSISQFTLQADTKKGNRPSYVHAMRGEEAVKLYEEFNRKIGEFVHVETGEFGADMKVQIYNDGPVTIILDSND